VLGVLVRRGFKCCPKCVFVDVWGRQSQLLRPSSQHYAKAPGRCVVTVTHVPVTVTGVPRNSCASHTWSTCVLRRVGGGGVTLGCAGVCRYRLPWRFSRARPRGCRTPSSSRLRRLEASGWCFSLALLLNLGPPVPIPSATLLFTLLFSNLLWTYQYSVVSQCNPPHSGGSQCDPPLFKSTMCV
jgi:hypothetical protein